MGYIDGLVQDCSNSSALAMELLHFCNKPSTYDCYARRWWRTFWYYPISLWMAYYQRFLIFFQIINSSAAETPFKIEGELKTPDTHLRFRDFARYYDEMPFVVLIRTRGNSDLVRVGIKRRFLGNFFSLGIISPWASYNLRKIGCCACPGNVFPTIDF